MKSDTVNPIPPNTDTAASDFQVVRVGIGTIFSLMTSHDERKIPRNFPTNSPTKTARLIPEKSEENSSPESTMPALAKANNGMMR